jgi:serine/threonine protein kinase/tetratricopeptide (TPR) repeat protein
MGEVWKGVHVEQGVDVAVKVLTREGVRRAGYIAAFRTEVRSTARLDHEGIVAVLDYGMIDARAEGASHHRLVAGSPYLAMQYARYGSLAEHQATMTWPDIREVLRRILNALAHAHARGVVHRDLKPQNVLLGVGPGGRLQITDFGLAHALGEDEPEVEVRERTGVGWGTPVYMAPEQFRGEWRQYGPWTDLYALGCMAYELAAGAPPFNAKTTWALGQMHLTEHVPRLEPRVDVPEGFESWLLRLMGKRIEERFQRAADALCGLEELGDAEEDSAQARALFTGSFVALDVERDEQPLSEDALEVAQYETQMIELEEDAAYGRATLVDSGPLPRLRGGQTTPGDSLRASEMTASLDDARTRAVLSAPVTLARPEPPSTWRDPGPRPGTLVSGAGLSLFGMRSPRLIGREDERDALWSALVDVNTARDVRMVVVRGAAGVGKSRLVEWMCERAHELGIADVWRASYQSHPGPFDGLAPMLARELGAQRLGFDAALEALDHRFGPVVDEAMLERLAVASMIATDEGGKDRVAFRNHEQRFGVLRRQLVRAAVRRDVILSIEDVHLGAEALIFAEYVLSRGKLDDLPMLIIVTLRDEELPARTVESALLKDLCARDDVSELHLGPMEDAHVRALVGGLIELEPDLAEQVVRRAEGVPMFAVELVGGWIEGKKLEPTEDGFSLKPGEDSELPEDLYQLWARRVRGWSAAMAEHQIASLDIAAALGDVFDEEEWRHACHLIQLDASERVLAAFIELGVFVREGDRVRFVHGMLREALERMARERGVWANLNDACVRMLERVHAGAPSHALEERMTRFLVEARRPFDAIGPWLGVIERRIERSELRRALRELDEREAVINTLDLPEQDPQRLRGWLLRASVLTQMGRYIDAASWASAAREHAERAEDREMIARSCVAHGYALLYRGATADASRRFARAVSALPKHGPSSVRVECAVGMARAAQRRGALDTSRALFERALEWCGPHDDLLRAQCLNGLGDLARTSRQLNRARRITREALDITERLGNRALVADCINDLAELDRLEGNLESAAVLCERAIFLYDSIDSYQSMRARQELAYISLWRGDIGRARSIFEELLGVFEQTQDLAQLCMSVVGLIPCLAAVEDWGGVEGMLARADDLVRRTLRRDDDVHGAAERAAAYADAGGMDALAARLRAFGAPHAPELVLASTVLPK